ncbi:acyltransferase [Bacillus sp. NP157]|nr:acyltransferase [Bacillus sp. NP157]
MSQRHNNFDALRLGGALLVALGHTMDIVLGYDGLGAATNNQSFGGLGLNIFCTISGYLIMRSRLRNDVRPFFTSRALRIFPALLIAVPLMALVLGPIYTALPLRDYFAAGGTWRFLASIFVYPLNPGLPGVFGGAGIIGQLYSLTAELTFYVFIGLLGRWRHFPALLIALLVVTWWIFLRTDYNSLPFSHVFSVQVGGTTTFFYPVRLATLCVFYLFTGAAVALAAPSPTALTRLACCLLPVWIIALYGPDRRVYDMIEMTMLPLIVLGVGLASRYTIRIPERFGDISYGVYVYHFAIAEAVFTSWPSAHKGWLTIGVALLVSILVGWLSFHLIEKRALARKAATSNAAVEDVSVAAQAATHASHHATQESTP